MPQKIHCLFDKMVPVSKLKPHPKNRNTHPKEQIKRLAKILEYQGWRYAVKVSTLSGFVTSGHGRIEAAKLLGWEKVPVVFQEYEDEKQEYADVQADNAIASWSELDLDAINEDIEELGKKFDLDFLGIEGFDPFSDKKGNCDPDEVPETPKKAITKTGDLWLLGDHRLLCGDSANKEDVERLMNSEKADMVFTDPPYNIGGKMDVGIFSNVKTSSQRAKKELSVVDWDKDFNIDPVLENLNIFSGKDCSIYICTSHFLAGKIWKSTEEWCDRIGWCCWYKPNASPSLQNRHWTWSCELICYATRGKHTFNANSGARTPNLWEINTERHTENHPTQKPVAISTHAISHSSNPGHLILDLFLGSGSTLIACEKTNRKCYGMEIDPLYCDVIVQRWEKFTGKKALLNSDSDDTVKGNAKSKSQQKSKALQKGAKRKS